jgi:hypothetical protein
LGDGQDLLIRHGPADPAVIIVLRLDPSRLQMLDQVRMEGRHDPAR